MHLWNEREQDDVIRENWIYAIDALWTLSFLALYWFHEADAYLCKCLVLFLLAKPAGTTVFK